MTTNHPHTPSPSRTRRVIFCIAAGVPALALLTATPNVLATWTSVNIQGLSDPQQARWDLGLEGIVDLLTLVAVVAALLRPARSALLVQYVLLAALTAGVVVVPFAAPFVFVVGLLLLLPLTYPYPRQLATLRSENGPSMILLAVAVIAAGMLAPLAVHAIRVQATLPRGTAPDFNGLATNAEHMLLLTLAGLLAATRRPGWRVLALTVTTAYAYLGLVSILLPDQPNSWGILGGTASLIGSAAFAIAAVLAAHGDAVVRAESRPQMLEHRKWALHR